MITWSVAAMECYPELEDSNNVVFRVHWRCNAEDGAIQSGCFSTLDIPAPTDSFTPYEELTKEQVLGWIWDNGVDKEATEAALLQQVEDQKNPPIVKLALPWSA